MPGAVLMICSAGRSTLPVELIAPDTMPSASPALSITAPKYSVLPGHQFSGLFGGHALGLAQFIQQAGVGSGLLAGLGVDDLHPGQIGAGFGGNLLYFVGIAQQRDFRNALIGDLPGRLNGTGLGALRQNDMHDLTLGFGFDFINRRHDTFLPYVLTIQLTCRYS